MKKEDFRGSLAPDKKKSVGTKAAKASFTVGTTKVGVHSMM